MGKICKFPSRRPQTNQNDYVNSDTNEMLGQFIETLVMTYGEKVKVLEGYKGELVRLNGLSLKSPKELLREVKALQQLFREYGISCNFFKFSMMDQAEVIYYNESGLIYVVKEGTNEEGITYTTGEFIHAYEGYPFTLNLDEALLNIFDKQIENLNITIDTLNNTQV